MGWLGGALPGGGGGGGGDDGGQRVVWWSVLVWWWWWCCWWWWWCWPVGSGGGTQMVLICQAPRPLSQGEPRPGGAWTGGVSSGTLLVKH